MPAQKRSSRNEPPRTAPVTTPEARELQLTSLAVDLAEKQLRDGTATAAVTIHYLKLATERDRLEREKLRRENTLLESKTAQLVSMETAEKLTRDAIEAFTKYKPGEDPRDHSD